MSGSPLGDTAPTAVELLLSGPPDLAHYAEAAEKGPIEHLLRLVESARWQDERVEPGVLQMLGGGSAGHSLQEYLDEVDREMTRNRPALQAAARLLEPWFEVVERALGARPRPATHDSGDAALCRIQRWRDAFSVPVHEDVSQLSAPDLKGFKARLVDRVFAVHFFASAASTTTFRHFRSPDDPASAEDRHVRSGDLVVLDGSLPHAIFAVGQGHTVMVNTFFGTTPAGEIICWT